MKAPTLIQETKKQKSKFKPKPKWDEKDDEDFFRALSVFGKNHSTNRNASEKKSKNNKHKKHKHSQELILV